MGVEVAAGAPLLLVHCATGQPLHLEGPEVKVPNDFGFEREVTARTATAPGLPCTLESLSQVRPKGGEVGAGGQEAPDVLALANARAPCKGGGAACGDVWLEHQCVCRGKRCVA
jgi:hypothetical protein